MILRDFTKLRYFADVDEPEVAFEGLAAIAAWTLLQDLRPEGQHDEMLTRAVRNSPGLLFGLLVFLATVDRRFFMLARRIAANEAKKALQEFPRREPLPEVHAANLYLLENEPPKSARPALARDVLFILAVAVAQALGLRPYENTSSPANERHEPRSGCRLLAARIDANGVSITYDAIAKAWKKGRRQKALVDAGFTSAEVEEFFWLLDRFYGKGPSPT